MIWILVGILVIGIAVGVVIAIISKVFGMDSFSMWNNEWFQKNDKDDNCK